MLKNIMKKAGIIIGISALVTFSGTVPLRAQGTSDYYLEYIMNYTHGILEKVNNLPDYLSAIAQMAYSWVKPDESDMTAELQSKFSTVANISVNDDAAVNVIQQRLQSDFLGSEVNEKTLPFANDLTYSTLLGHLYFNPDPRKETDKDVDPVYNYIKNASGTLVQHPVPNPNWSGDDVSKKKYLDYYSTISAVQTFNNYLLGQNYVNAVQGNMLTALENDLINKASNADWFSQVASEDIGIVLRQLLMFSSQQFVVMTQILQAQRQQVAAQALSNTLLILGNQFTENTMLSSAKGEGGE